MRERDDVRSGTARIAAVDVGTNTALLLVADVEGGRLDVVEEQERFVRLGEGVDASGQIGRVAVERLVEALAGYDRRARTLGAFRRAAVATSAMRDAANRREVTAEVVRRTGWRLRVIDGDREAALAFRGAVSAFSDLAGRCAVLDIGGGSTELIVGDATGRAPPDYRRSLDLGAVRLTERCFTRQPPPEGERRAAERLVERALEEAAVPQEAGLPLVGAAGTPTALAMVYYGLASADLRAAPPALPAEVVHRWCRRLFTLDYSQVLALHDEAMPGRADVFPAGVLLLDAFVRRLGAAAVRVSPRGLRHGLALDASN